MTRPTGLISEAKGAELDSAVGPTPMTTGPSGDVELLRAEALELNKNTAVREAILADLEPVRESRMREGKCTGVGARSVLELGEMMTSFLPFRIDSCSSATDTSTTMKVAFSAVFFTFFASPPPLGVPQTQTLGARAVREALLGALLSPERFAHSDS